MNLTLGEINLVINEAKRLNEIHEQQAEQIRLEHQREIEELNLKFNRQLRDLTDIHHIVEGIRDNNRNAHLIELQKLAERKHTFVEDLKDIIAYIWACVYCAALALKIAKPVRSRI